MPFSPYHYSSYYPPRFEQYTDSVPDDYGPYSPDYSPQDYRDFAFSRPEYVMSNALQQSPSPSVPIDPALALYPPYYSSSSNYSTQHHGLSHLSLPSNYSSPSSQTSDTIATPPTEHMYPSSSTNGKRPASASNTNESRKKARKDDDSVSPRSPTLEKEEKVKPTRGSRACTVCRRLKMKCVGAEQGPPCKRCQAGNHECIFEESNRGKRSSKKHEILTRSIRKMERTLDTVLKSIGNPTIAAEMMSRTPSPVPQSTTAQSLIATSNQPHNASFGSSHQQHPSSPKLHSLPDNSLNPLGLLAEASLANRRAQSATGQTETSLREPKLGVASDNYFKPGMTFDPLSGPREVNGSTGPMTILPLRRLYIERQNQPEMLGFVSTNEVVRLFDIYFDHMNMHCNVLDRDFHTPSLVCSRSPFLLTTICAIASKFYTENPELHSRLNELAIKLAFQVPSQGYKSIEIVQAYLLLTLWGCGAVERFEQDKTWLLLGMAIRMATDLNLHRKTTVPNVDLDTEENRARDFEIHNRERTWLFCFCLDRSHSALMGKPYCIKEDFIIRNVESWCSSRTAIPSDTGIAAYAELQRILSRSLDFLYSNIDSTSGLHTSSLDYMLVIQTFEDQIYQSRQRWINRSNTHTGKETVAFAQYTSGISEFYFNYAMLVLNSFGLQNALESSPLNMGHFFGRVHTAAVNCATIVRDHLGPSGFMKYSPDSHCVQTSYAVLSLLKLVRPEFSAYLNDEHKTLKLVKDVADVLENISVSPQHTTALYGGFLKAMISARLEPNHQTNGDAGHSSSSSTVGSMPPPQTNGFRDTSKLLSDFQLEGEMGPVMDMSTFPPLMAPHPADDSNEHGNSGLAMDSILSSNFWDSVLVPGYNTTDGLTGGFVFGANGSGLITPRMGLSPFHSGANTPSHGHGMHNDLTQMSINAAFHSPGKLEG